MSGPFWSKPLWDSDSNNDGESDGWFSAPNIMTIAKVAGSIAGGGPWLSFALDAVDTAYNVASGNMSLKDGLVSVGKSGLTSVASGFASGIGAGIGDSIASAGLGSVTASVASSVATSYANTYISGAINSLEFDGGLSFNKDKFKQSTKGAWKSAAISGATALVSSSIMSAGGAKWSNGRMGFTDKVGGSLEFANSWQKSISTIGNTAGAIAGQSLSAAFGNGFTMNFKGALQLQIGGKNAGFSVGGGGVSLDGIAGMVRGLGQLSDMKKSKEVQFLLNNHNSSEGMARMTYANMGIKSGNENAIMTSWDVINGDKSLVFNKDLKEGHFGHAGVNNNQIQLNAEAMNISADTLGKAGFYTSTMAREGYLIDRNHALGVSGLSDQDMRDSGFGAMLTREAFKMQSGVLGDISKNMGIKFDGQWGGMKSIIDNVAKTGDLSGWKKAGRDFGFDVDARKFKNAGDQRAYDRLNRITMATLNIKGARLDAKFRAVNALDRAADSASIKKNKGTIEDQYRQSFFEHVDKTGKNIQEFAINMLDTVEGNWKYGWKTELGNKDGTRLLLQKGFMDSAKSADSSLTATDVLLKMDPNAFKVLYDLGDFMDAEAFGISSMLRGPGNGVHTSGLAVDISSVKFRGTKEKDVRSPNGRPYTGTYHNRTHIEGYTAGPSPDWAKQITQWASDSPYVKQIIGPWEINWNNHWSDSARENDYAGLYRRTKQDHWHHFHVQIRVNPSTAVLQRALYKTLNQTINNIKWR